MQIQRGALAFSVLAAVVLFGATASAEEPPPENGAEGAAPPHPANKLDDVRYHDAHTDRVVFGSTAETHPQGTFFFTDYEILLLQFGYAVTDDLQLSIAGLPPIVKDQPYFFDFGLKYNITRGEVFRAAFKGALDVVTTGGNGTNTGPYFGGRLGLVGQFCFELTCRSSVSLDGGALITSGAKDVLPIYGAAGAIVKASSLVSFLFEPALLGALGTGSGNVDSGAFFFLDYGVRLSGKNFGVDLTLIKPLATTTGNFQDPFILGYPYVIFTYRTDGDRKTGGATAGNFGSVARTLGQSY